MRFSWECFKRVFEKRNQRRVEVLQVEVLYDPSDPKDKDVTADEVIERYDNFKKKVKNGCKHFK